MVSLINLKSFSANKLESKVMQTKCIQLLQVLKVLIITPFLTVAAYAGHSQAILDTAQTPLELTPTVAANVMILLDDSGSMDFEVITADALSSGLFFGPDSDGSNFGSTQPELQITHRADCELTAAAFGGYAYGIAAPTTNHYTPPINPGDPNLKNCYVADARAWRFRCSSFNTLYYNPDPAVRYEPWAGLRSDGTEFPDVPANAAPLDPYQANSSTVDLTSPDIATGIDKFRVYQCGRDGLNGPFVNRSADVVGGDETEGVPITDMQNFANWFSYHRSRHLRAKALLGNFIFNQVGTRIGLVRFNFTTQPSLTAEEMNVSAEDDGAKRTLLNALYSTTPEQLSSLVNERSPLHKRHIETARYLECENSDAFPSNPECPAEATPAGTCQTNHIVVATDGFSDRFPFSFSGDEGIGNADADSSNLFDGGAFADSSNFGLLSTFSDVAISFYKNDIQGSLTDKVVPTPADINRYPNGPPDEFTTEDELHQHIKTHVVSYDVPFTGGDQDLVEFPPNPFDPFPWQSPLDTNLGLLQDLVHAAYSGRGEKINANIISSDGGQDLAQVVAQGVGSTTPVAINTQATSANVVLYRTFYDSSSNSGDLVAQVIDTDGLLETENGEPVFMWSAAKQLDELVGENGTSNSQRIIFTYSDNSNDGINFNFDDLDSNQQTQLNQPVPGMLTVGEDRLEYLRGLTTREGSSFDNGEFRIRPETESTGGGIVHNAKLGTIANAAPVFVGLPQAVGRFGGAWPSTQGNTYFEFQTSQANRDASVLAAANDGMFHVFNANNGNERFAYIPSLVFENLSVLTLPEYKHQFFVDSTPSVEDAYIRATGSSSPSWNTIAVGGLGAGGRGYYALNITVPDPASTAVDQVMWEFGPEDDAVTFNGDTFSDLGLSFGRPLIAMSNATDGSNQKWVAVFGNGYNSASFSGNAVIYMLFIDQGIDGVWSTSDFVKIDTDVGGSGTPNGIADVRAIDIDANGTIDWLYAGDLRGNLHAVNIESAVPNDWSLSSNRSILFEAGYSQTGEPQPITTRPIVVNNENGAGVIVVFATGSYFTNSDAIDTDIQSIYGIEDNFSGNEVDADDLVEQTLSNQFFTDGATTLDVRVLNEVAAASSDRGWFIDFDVLRSSGSGVEFPGEKVVRALQLRNDVLFMNTIIPQELSCDPSPGGFLLALDPQTGTAGQEVIFDINTDSIFDDQDKINVSSELKVIVGTRFKSPPSGSTFFGDYRITQLSDTSIDSIRTNTAKTELVGRQAWREVEF